MEISRAEFERLVTDRKLASGFVHPFLRQRENEATYFYSHVQAMWEMYAAGCSAGMEERNQLLELAGKILGDAQDNEWMQIEYDGCDVETMLIKAGLIEQIDVTGPCREEGCACAELGFPTRCNRTTELGRAAILKRKEEQ